MKKLFLSLIFIIPFISKAQEQPSAETESGQFQLGIRSTVSAFSDDGFPGTGAGGQFRVRFGKKLNSEWFADYITTDIGGLARREDVHVGWSVMFYPFSGNTAKENFTPYILAGHCFDHTTVKRNSPGGYSATRWSSAIQGGIGTHYNLSDMCDISLSTQYMSHLGKDIHAEIFTGPDNKEEVLIAEGGVGIEGHLLVTLSLNILVADIWKK
jgi:opacity protein-like surface antigen